MVKYIRKFRKGGDKKTNDNKIIDDNKSNNTPATIFSKVFPVVKRTKKKEIPVDMTEVTDREKMLEDNDEIAYNEKTDSKKSRNRKLRMQISENKKKEKIEDRMKKTSNFFGIPTFDLFGKGPIIGGKSKKKTLKRKTLKRKTLKRKTLKRKTSKRKL